MAADDGDERYFAHLDSMGAEQVRLLMSSGGLSPATYPATLRWLKLKDDEAQRVRDLSQAEQADTSRLASSAAVRAAAAAERAASAAERQAAEAQHANTIAKAALTIAIISIITTIIGIWVVHRDVPPVSSPAPHAVSAASPRRS
jgi:hypothetical protein